MSAQRGIPVALCDFLPRVEISYVLQEPSRLPRQVCILVIHMSFPFFPTGGPPSGMGFIRALSRPEVRLVGHPSHGGRQTAVLLLVRVPSLPFVAFPPIPRRP